MAQVISNSGHEDMIHDAVLDYYGRRLATCSSDLTIKIFTVEPNDTHRLTDTLKGHSGPVWCVSWAHPKFGTLLASCAFDGRIIIWRETAGAGAQGGGAGGGTAGAGQWTKAFDYADHTASVNLVAWAPAESGCLLAGASSDGKVSVIELRDNVWTPIVIPAHGVGVNAVAWAPSVAPGLVTSASSSATGSSSQQQQPLRRFVTGGSDCVVKIWDWQSETGSYTCVKTLQGHTDWVRDVAWAPTILSKSYIASASQDKTVRIWTTRSDNPAGEWQCTILNFDSVAWRVSWSMSGNVLAVSTGDNKVSLWKERLSGEWENVKTIEE